MRTIDESIAIEVIDGWRDGDPWNGFNPAGPLFAGEYAEHELTMTGGNTRRPTVCTGAGGRQCC